METAPPSTLFDEIIDFLASGPAAEQIVSFEPPATLQVRLSELLEKNRLTKLSEAESVELEEFLRMNRFMSRLKLRARQKLGSV